MIALFIATIALFHLSIVDATSACNAHVNACHACLATQGCSFCSSSGGCYDNAAEIALLNACAAYRINVATNCNGTRTSSFYNGGNVTTYPNGNYSVWTTTWASNQTTNGNSSAATTATGATTQMTSDNNGTPATNTAGAVVTDANGNTVTDSNGKPLTTAGISLPTDARGCLVLSPATLSLPLGCTLDLVTWNVACGGGGGADAKPIVSVPEGSSPKAIVNTLAVALRRCDAPKVELSIGYELKLSAPFGTASVLKDMGIELPQGPQTLNVTKGLVNGQDVEIPVFPQSGIVKVSNYKLGVAVLLTKVTVEGAAVSFGLALRACLFATTCIDTPLLNNIELGTKTAGVCCLDPALQCDSERTMCSPPSTATTGARGDAETSGPSTTMTTIALTSLVTIAFAALV